MTQCSNLGHPATPARQGPTPPPPWTVRAPVLSAIIIAVLLGAVFGGLQTIGGAFLFSPTQVALMAAGLFLWTCEPINAAMVARARDGASPLDRLHYPVLLAWFWGALMLMASADTGWPTIRLEVLIWIVGASVFALLFIWQGKALSTQQRDGVTFPAARVRRAAIILQLAFGALWLAVLLLSERIWDDPALAIGILLLGAGSSFAGTPAAGHKRGGRMAVWGMGAFLIVAGYALG